MAVLTANIAFIRPHKIIYGFVYDTVEKESTHFPGLRLENEVRLRRTTICTRLFSYDKKSVMKTADDFTGHYSDLLDGTYDCVDRIVLNAYFSPGQTAGGFRCWWRQLYGSDVNLDRAHVMRMAGDFRRRLEGFAKKRKMPFVQVPVGERKDQLWQKHLPADPNFQGLFLVLVGRAPAPVWEISRTGDRIRNIFRKKAWPYVNHFYFHIIVDREWGHIIIRMCCYPPFGAQIILNGHEWVERQARKRGVPLEKVDNCFVGSADFPALEEIAKALQGPSAEGRLRQVCDRWIYSTALCFGLATPEQEKSGFRYEYSLFQLELSRNLLFQRGSTMEEVYRKVIDRTRGIMDLKRLKTIFGFQKRPQVRKMQGSRVTRLQMTIERPTYNLTVWKVQWGKLTLKMYDKGDRVLRIEVIVHNTKALRCGTGLGKWENILNRMHVMLNEFLNNIQAAHQSFINDEAFEKWAQPTNRGTRRLAGIDMNKPRMRSVMEGVLALSIQPGGFTVDQLIGQVQKYMFEPMAYGVRQATYDLAKLAGKSMIQHTPRKRRYTVNTDGIRQIAAFLIIRDHVLKPILAGVQDKRRGRPLKVVAPIDVHYLGLRKQLRETLSMLGIAA